MRLEYMPVLYVNNKCTCIVLYILGDSNLNSNQLKVIIDYIKSNRNNQLRKWASIAHPYPQVSSLSKLVRKMKIIIQKLRCHILLQIPMCGSWGYLKLCVRLEPWWGRNWSHTTKWQWRSMCHGLITHTSSAREATPYSPSSSEQVITTADVCVRS